MSEPTSPPPPPATPPPAGPTGADVARQVQGPAVGLVVTAALGIVWGLYLLISHLFGMSMSGLADMAEEFGDGDRWIAMLGGGMGIFWSLVKLASSAFVAWSGLEMQKLRRYSMAVAASVLAMIPCFGPCCFVGVPIGIWCLVVLMKPEVKAAFVS